MAFPSLATFRSPFSVLRFVGVCGLGLALDLFTKVIAFRELLIDMSPLPSGRYEVISRTLRLIPGWIHFEVTVNQGAVFGIGQGQRWLFVGVSIIAIGFLSLLFAASQRKQWLYHILLGMLLAGVLGNLFDRIEFGYVRDMIHAFPRWPNLFPYIFNVADMMLCTGVGSMLLYSYLQKPAPLPKREDIRLAEPSTATESLRDV